MSTVADLIEETRELLHGTYRAAYNVLSSPIDADDRTLTFDHALGLLEDGSILSAGRETIFVISTSGTEATVVRGFLGSTAQTHDAGALVEVNPRFTRNAIARALRQEIRGWGTSLYRAVALDPIPVTASSRAVDLDSTLDIYRLLGVRRSARDTVAGTLPREEATLAKGLPASEFPSLQGLFLAAPADTAMDLYAVVATGFDTATWDEDTDLADVGLSVNMEDIPPVGAAARLLAGVDVRATDTEAQGEYRRDEAVQPGTASQVAARLRRIADERIATEANRLTALWGWTGGTA